MLRQVLLAGAVTMGLAATPVFAADEAFVTKVAKDGIDLPPQLGKAQLTITVGETYDVEFSTDTPQDLLLDLLLPAQKIHVSQTLAFLPPTGE